jgi:putative ABC transport system permease protein
MGVEDYSTIYIRASGSPDNAKLNIQRVLSRDILSIQTKQEEEAANNDKVIGIFSAINTYAYFAMLIGVLGIINNMVACFLDHRRGIALYRCVGMSLASSGRMTLSEAAAIGIIGTIAGMGVGMMMIQTVPFVVGMIWGNVTAVIPWLNLAILCAAGIAAMLLSSLVPLLKGRKISIMNTIRYE